jgi:signal transduction histidine kinase
MIDSMTASLQGVAKRDIAIAAVLTVLGLALMALNVADPPPRPSDEQAAVHVGNLLPYALGIPLFLLVTVPLLWRRVAPLAAIGAALAGLGANELLVGTEFIRCGVLLPTAFVFGFTTGAELDGREARIGLALCGGLVLLGVGLEFGPVVAGVAAGITTAMWTTGRIVRSRRQMVGELEDRTIELRQARDERARLDVATDRARLSGELDELLQRRLGELAAMADEGVGDSANAGAKLAEIEHASRRTLDEMRAVVGVLRDDSSELPTAPQPALTHIEGLLVRAKGADARLSVEGSPRVLPVAVELSAYRIVEHLLAAMEDAPEVDVCVRFRDDALELEVSGPARRRAKAAIERARERARLERGTLEATLRGGRADAVVSLPVASVA